jgi:2-keto-3-deoxy-L-rhamnonate aldolase RhmA
MVEMAAYSGFDFIRLDLEHNLIDMTTLGNQIRTANFLGIPVVGARLGPRRHHQAA